jgi:hypothetical protein
MKMRPILALFLFAAFTAAAQNTLNLQRTTTRPTVDGTIAAREYTLSADAPDMQVNLTWTTDALFVGISGQTTGWVAVGLGSGGMDGATIFIGYVAGGKTELRVQEGSGHSHHDANAGKPRQVAMTEARGKTTLEVELNASEFIQPGQTQLDLILAMGSADSFQQYHQSRYGASVTLTP